MSTVARLDEAFHAPVRFAVMATLLGVDRAEFSLVRDSAGVSDSVMSKQASTLEAAGYLSITKGYVGKRPRTWFSLTPAGREAFTGHLQALRQLADTAAAFAPSDGEGVSSDH